MKKSINKGQDLTVLLEAEVGDSLNTKKFILAEGKEALSLRRTSARYYFLYGNTNNVESMGIILAKNLKTGTPIANFKTASKHFFRIIKTSKNIVFKN